MVWNIQDMCTGKCLEHNDRFPCIMCDCQSVFESLCPSVACAGCDAMPTTSTMREAHWRCHDYTAHLPHCLRSAGARAREFRRNLVLEYTTSIIYDGIVPVPPTTTPSTARYRLLRCLRLSSVAVLRMRGCRTIATFALFVYFPNGESLSPALRGAAPHAHDCAALPLQIGGIGATHAAAECLL